MAEALHIGEITACCSPFAQVDRAAESELVEKPCVAGSASATIQDRVHYFAVAARVMRWILVDHARFLSQSSEQN